MSINKQKTYMQRKEDVSREWHLSDAADQILGKLATDIAQKLIGKHKATYTPHTDGGDYVVVINAKKIVVTRNKADKKIYYRHTSYPGGLKELTFAEMIERKPEEVIRLAVKNMLPKNKMRAVRMTKLKIYADSEHKHQSQLSGLETQV